MIQVIAIDLNGVLFPTPRQINHTVMKFVEECKDFGYRLVIASNASKGSFEWRNGKYNIMRIFDGRIISSDIGMRKPSKEFFKYMIDVLGFNSNEILFIDDSARNIESAESLGIKCMKYKGEKTLDKIRVFLKNDRKK